MLWGNMRQLDIVRAFSEARPVLKEYNQDPLATLTRAGIEIVEAVQVVGDKDKLGHELADVLWFVLATAISQGIDIEQAFDEKKIRNDAKYPAEFFQDGDYHQIIESLRREWEEAGGDATFFEYFGG